MKDKEKQIEEMARDMDYGCTKRDLYPSDAKEIAKALYLIGYRKLPKYSVVLSREEYEKLKLFEERVRSGVCFTQKEWFDFCNEDSKKRTSLLIEAKEQASKETAEKILNELHLLFSADYLVGLRNEYKDWKYADLIKRYARQLGVEIKE